MTITFEEAVQIYQGRKLYEDRPLIGFFAELLFPPLHIYGLTTTQEKAVAQGYFWNRLIEKANPELQKIAMAQYGHYQKVYESSPRIY